uniref:Uncharacterized protein n=1 Tax=Strongyloides stercoralis TaxID=6248 RepID=A0AAF5DGY9_STRER
GSLFKIELGQVLPIVHLIYNWYSQVSLGQVKLKVKSLELVALPNSPARVFLFSHVLIPLLGPVLRSHKEATLENGWGNEEGAGGGVRREGEEERRIEGESRKKGGRREEEGRKKEGAREEEETRQIPGRRI